jgi:hypothetical protein
MLLAGAAIVLAGLGIFLFLEVRQAPAQPPAQTAKPSRPVAEVTNDTPPPALADKATPQPAAAPAPAPHPPITGDLRPNGEGMKRKPEFGAPLDLAKVNPKLDSLMDEANKAYDRGEFEEARALATKVLAKVPTNPRMLRIMVSAACQENDAADAQRYYNQLPASDRAQMKIRCDRYGVTFTDPPAQ